MSFFFLPEFENDEEREEYFLKNNLYPEELDSVSFLRWLDCAEVETLEFFGRKEISVQEVKDFTVSQLSDNAQQYTDYRFWSGVFFSVVFFLLVIYVRS